MDFLWIIGRFFKGCFSKIWNKQFLIFLFFLMLSTAFWLFQALNETYERDYTVPIELKNVPENVVITTELPKTAQLRLRDKGVTLLNYVYGKRLRPIVIDYTNYANASGHARIPVGDVTRQVAATLEGSTQVVNFRPDTLEFFYNFGLCKRVPVRLQGKVRTGRIYHLSETRLSVDSVTVYAAKALLDTITAAYLQPIYLRDVADTTVIHSPVQPVRGAKFEPSTVGVTLFVDRLVEKTVQVPIQWVNFPATKALRTFPSKVNITFQVGMGMYRSITADNFVIVVNYEDLLENKSNKCHLSLKTVPPGVSHVRLNPTDVEYVIEEVPED